MTQSIDYFSLWTTTVGSIPYWELAVGVGVVAVGSLLLFFEDMAWMHRLGIFHSFERIRIKRRDLEESLSDSTYIEITIPKDSHATAFQIQQKIIKSFHSVFSDPIDGQHHFSKTFYLFQKMYRLWKVSRSKQIFFTLQVFARYPYISFRANIPSHCLDRIEKAIFNAYPNAEIAVLEKSSVAADIATFPKHYLAYGQSTVEGPFW